MGESGIGCGDVIYSNLTFMIHVSGFEMVPKLKTDGLTTELVNGQDQ